MVVRDLPALAACVHGHAHGHAFANGTSHIFRSGHGVFPSKSALIYARPDKHPLRRTVYFLRPQQLGIRTAALAAPGHNHSTRAVNTSHAGKRKRKRKRQQSDRRVQRCRGEREAPEMELGGPQGC
ncbi:hypothetical protein B5807_08575 [Epicoccum nigrum]|uniref:Uncharacterized protein n=1 Tax=Epicoccum nigrum TaxID=105696 RepID=A0A1Y2LRA0_EPING|nr:hypothetical protein B5807_08575 [Epicoccum nigrum]